MAALLPPLLERHIQALELIRGRAEQRDGTIFFDIADHPLEGFNKFIPYYLYPQATYSIGLSKSSFRTKVAVGSNPWTKADPGKDGEPGPDLRALRRRRPCPRRSHQLPSRPGSESPRRRRRDCGRTQVEESSALNLRSF